FQRFAFCDRRYRLRRLVVRPGFRLGVRTRSGSRKPPVRRPAAVLYTGIRRDSCADHAQCPADHRSAVTWGGPALPALVHHAAQHVPGRRIATSGEPVGCCRVTCLLRSRVDAKLPAMCAVACEDRIVEITSLNIAEVKLLVPQIHRDARGFFSETWSRRDLQAAGIAAE